MTKLLRNVSLAFSLVLGGFLVLTNSASAAIGSSTAEEVVSTVGGSFINTLVSMVTYVGTEYSPYIIAFIVLVAIWRAIQKYSRLGT